MSFKLYVNSYTDYKIYFHGGSSFQRLQESITSFKVIWRKVSKAFQILMVIVLKQRDFTCDISNETFQYGQVSLTIPLQKSFAHPCVSTFGPTQSFPPPDGAGLLHSLVRLCAPPPHVFVQLVQSLQLPYFPSTKNVINETHHNMFSKQLS